jgi:ubiquinone/menaquinone biosynthesis C-methylase UbiE
MRPSYPKKLFIDLKRLTAIPVNGRILEIGCGTGQATFHLAADGYRMTCIDIGENLLKIARSKGKRYPKVCFIHSSFEEWPPGNELFDVVMSATAFHWIKPEIGCNKAAMMLKDSGSIALFWNKHPTPYTGFFSDVQAVYEEVVPEWGNPSSQSINDWITDQINLIVDSQWFSEVVVRSYPWSVYFSKEEYLRLLDTYSDHASLNTVSKTRLYEGIARLIDEKYNGRVQRPYLSILFTARKASLEHNP